MKALTAFLPWVEPHVLGAPQPLILQALRDSCIELCERANIIQTVDVQDVTAALPDYDVAAPSQQRLTTVIAVTYLNQRLTPVASDMVDAGGAMRAGVDTAVAPSFGTPTSFYQSSPSDRGIHLWPVPDVTAPGALAIRAAFAPTRTATQVEDVLFDEWISVVVSGALAQLHSVPDQIFTNLRAAERHGQAAYAGIRSAAAEARTGSTRGSLRIKGRRFA